MICHVQLGSSKQSFFQFYTVKESAGSCVLRTDHRDISAGNKSENRIQLIRRSKSLIYEIRDFECLVEFVKGDFISF
jgi:hypothetical protein